MYNVRSLLLNLTIQLNSVDIKYKFILLSLDYNLVFGFSALGLDKEGRLNYGESLMTHAMLITAFHKVSTNIKRVHTIMYADNIVTGLKDV